jgi:hypothetical protein
LSSYVSRRRANLGRISHKLHRARCGATRDVDSGAGVELRVRENPTNDRHGIVGYLDAPNIAKKILDALDA